MGYRLRSAPARKRLLDAHLQAILATLPHTNVQKAILFGSLATGQVGSHSDLDLILIRETDRPFIHRADDLVERWPAGVATDVLIYTPAEWDRWRQTNRFMRQAEREGKVVYEAGSHR